MRRRLGPTLLAISLLTAVAGIGVAAASRFVFPFRPRLVHIVVRLPRRHAGLHGTTIGFVTDTHIGPHFAATDLAPVASMLRNARPDIVLFGGDYVSESPRFLKDAAVAVGEIAATGRYGSWGIVGNHDLSNIRPRIEAALAGAGITLLTNSAACVDLPGGELWIAGIDDAILGRPDLEAAFRGIPSDAPSIALWHEPDRAERTAPFGPFLQLSGHSHGGQVRLPFLGEIAAPVLGRRFVRGRYEIGDLTLYVSSGVGMYRPPVRLNCPPEVTLVHLVA